MTGLLIRLFIKNHTETKDNTVRQRYGKLGGFVGICCNLFLCALKITVGIISGSISVLADGFNNLADMGSSVIAIIGFKLAGKPADNEHPFGHGRMEYMSAFIVAILIFLVGFELLKSSANALIGNEPMPHYSIIPIIILIISILVKFWMFLFNRKIGKTIDSSALIATAQDSLNDMVATLAILISVVVSKLVTLPFNLDAVMGALVAVFILISGFSTAKQTLDEILGKPPEKSLIKDIETTILSFKEFIGIHDLIIHNYGPGRQFASVHVEVPIDSVIVKCHEQIDLCEKLIEEQLDIHLVIHMDPIDVNNAVVNHTKAQMAEAIKVIHEKMTLHDFRMTPISDMRTNLIFDVVVPSDLKLTTNELNDKINVIAQLINPTFQCVITFDNAYT